MLKQRVITASILAAAFLLILLAAPPWVFTGFIGLTVAFSAWEWANLANIVSPALRVGYSALVVLLGLALGYCVLVAELIPVDSIMLAGGVWWAVALLWVQAYPASAVLWRSTAMRALMGLLVLLPALLALWSLRHMVNGQLLVLAVVLLVAAADIGAYFAGRALGKRKLAPRVSPGKTWAGAVGGVVTAGIIAAGYAWVMEVNLLLTLAVALPTAAASIIGDLLESMLKRHRGIKDSSQLLPGHGGVLDRIDGLLAAAPIFALAVLGTGWQI